MKERPIPFSTPMVLALLAGKKSQTRRIMKRQLGGAVLEGDPGKSCFTPDGMLSVRGRAEDGELGEWFLKCPFGMPGDRLWVREPWWTARSLDNCKPSLISEGDTVIYQADWVHRGQPDEPGRYRHARFMCRWMSRLTLEVTEVRVQRLHNISDADAIAEGVEPTESVKRWSVFREDGSCVSVGVEPVRGQDCGGMTVRDYVLERDIPGFNFFGASTAKDNYSRLWDSINGSGSWDANPWCWAISFHRATP